MRDFPASQESFSTRKVSFLSSFAAELKRADPQGGWYFGPAGWSYEDWKGRVYPRRPGRGFHPLSYLARSVNLMEVNATFYAPVRARSAEDWVRKVHEAPDFRFVVKAWQRFTHAGADLPSSEEARMWAEVLRPLQDAGRLLAVLVQFPFSVVHGTRIQDRILAIRAALGAVPVACEFRHASWITDEALGFLEREGLAFVNIDQPLGRDSLPPTAIQTAPLTYVRLHGRNRAAWFSKDAGRDARYDYHYSEAELNEWRERMQKLQATGATNILVGNNHFHGKAVAAVLSLMNQLTGAPMIVPEPLLEQFPELQRFRQTPPGELF